MRNFKHAFTLIELVFVIVILGILAAVAYPKLSGVTKDANLAQGLATVSAIRAAIANERQRSLIKGSVAYPPYLDIAVANTEGANLFDGNATEVIILQYPIHSRVKQGGWMKRSANTANPINYEFCITAACTGDGKATFGYDKDTGLFDCTHTNQGCKDIFGE